MPRTSVEINKPQVLFEPYDKSQKKKTQEANRTLGMFYFNENFPTDATKPKLCSNSVTQFVSRDVRVQTEKKILQIYTERDYTTLTAGQVWVGDYRH